MNYRNLRARTSALTLVVAIAACGGGSLPSARSPLSQSAVSPLPSRGPIVASTSFSWGAPALKQMTYVGAAKETNLTAFVLVNMNAQGLLQYARDASDPTSSLYRRWLTPQQIGARFGASNADYVTVAKYFAKMGLHVGGWPQREVLNVMGSVAQFQKAFGTNFGTYTSFGRHVIAPTGTPHFSAPLPVTAVVGLVGGLKPLQTFIIQPNLADVTGYSPLQLGTGLDYSGAWRSGITGSGINVGIIGTGPILLPNGNDADTAALGKYWHTPMATVTQIPAVDQPPTAQNGETGTAAADAADAPYLVPPFAIGQGDPPETEDGEAQLDSESVASLAPGANALFYLAGYSYCMSATTGAEYPAPCNPEDFAFNGDGLEDVEVQQAIADDKADVLSLSYGTQEPLAQSYGLVAGSVNGAPGVDQIEFASLAAEGIAVFVASGDDGAWECINPAASFPPFFYTYTSGTCASYPATDPNVTSVGGANIPLDANGNLTASITAWGDSTTLGGDGSFTNNVGSGGGVSAVFTPPPWQVATIGKGISMREFPDISMDADPDTGPSIVMNATLPVPGAGQPATVGGTSAAAPEAAAQWGLVLQACKASATCNRGGNYRLGNPAPLLYAIYGESKLAAGPYTAPNFTPQLPYEQTFYDIVYGGNQAVPAPQTPAPQAPGGFVAGPGYDEVTGLGVPFTGHLIQAITGTKVP